MISLSFAEIKSENNHIIFYTGILNCVIYLTLIAISIEI